jgi:hypothetical protein
MTTRNGFEQFKSDIEGKLKEQATFNLEEFTYLPRAFGHGVLAYRVKGYIVRFTYNGRDNLLTCERSHNHEIYPHCRWNVLFESSELVINQTDIDLLLKA